MWPAFRRQLAYEDFFLKRELPPTARPYRDELHAISPGLPPGLPDIPSAPATPAE